jgi:hypothetical protein
MSYIRVLRVRATAPFLQVSSIAGTKGAPGVKIISVFSVTQSDISGWREAAENRDFPGISSLFAGSGTILAEQEADRGWWRRWRYGVHRSDSRWLRVKLAAASVAGLGVRLGVHRAVPGLLGAVLVCVGIGELADVFRPGIGWWAGLVVAGGFGLYFGSEVNATVPDSRE